MCSQVSLLVPIIGNKSQETEVKVIRSISDVVKAKESNNTTITTTTAKLNSAARKTKEERRISNRQKLLTIAKRHSGFLKRPDILETVYSVEEDGEQQQQQQQQQKDEQQQQQQQQMIQNDKVDKAEQVKYLNNQERFLQQQWQLRAHGVPVPVRFRYYGVGPRLLYG